MERKKPFSFSTILMFVGILFIVVSGGIFVSSTWQYLPETVKKLAMTAVTCGLFAGSAFAERKLVLKKTSAALYYLGICFTGFTVFSFAKTFLDETCSSLILAMLCMSIPVILHFLQKRQWIDSLFQILLLDGITVCICASPLEEAPLIGILTASIVTLLLALFAKYCKECLPEEKGMQVSTLAFLGIHTILLLPCMIAALSDSRNFLFTVLPAVMLAASFTVLYITYRTTALRIFQSMSLLYLNFSVSAFFLQNFCGELTEKQGAELLFFCMFLLNLVWMVLLDRKELFIVNGSFMMQLSLVQVFSFLIMGRLHANGMTDLAYYPYALCLAAALVLWKYFMKQELPWMPLLKYVAILLCMEGNALLSYLIPDYGRNYSLSFWFALLFLQIGFFCRSNNFTQSLFRTFALATALLALIASPILPTTIYAADGMTAIANFNMEYISVFLGLGIVLLGFIWYDYKKMIRIIQLIATCCLLAFVLIGNLVIQELPNVMFLGISMLILLVVASVLKQKAYTVAAAVTLTLVALYLTRAFWMSITWWVYLFAAGVGLVIFAVKRERDEKKVA